MSHQQRQSSTRLSLTLDLAFPSYPGSNASAIPPFTRTFLAMAAIWEGLKAYPTAETQTAIATFLPVLIYSVCLHDAFQFVKSQPSLSGILPSASYRTTQLCEASLIAILLCGFIALSAPLAQWRTYRAMPSLNLPGTNGFISQSHKPPLTMNLLIT